MKKLSKFIYFIFAFALITCMAIFNPAITFADADEADVTTSLLISGSKMDKVVENGKGEELIIPMPKVENVSGSHDDYIVVKDRTGVEYTYDCQTGETLKKGKPVSVDYFTKLDENKNVIASNDTTTEVKYVKVAHIGKGEYTVRYKAVAGGKTYYSEAQQIQVNSVAHSWEFETADDEGNVDKKIIPSITNTVNSEGEQVKYALPLPTIINSQDANLNKTYDKNDAGEYIKVIKNGGGDANDLLVKGEDEDNNLYFVPTLAEGEETATYTIKYVSKVTSFPDKTYTVKVDSEYNNEAKLEVTHNTISNVQAGAPITLPTANVTDKTHNKSGVEVDTVITIKGNGDTYVLTNNYTVTINKTGYYTVEYKVTDAYGNTATSKTASMNLNNKKPYLVAYADTYSIEGDNWEDSVNTNVAHKIYNEVGYNGFEVPAIYAKDYMSGYNALKWERKLVATDGSGIEFDIDSADNGAWTAPAEGQKEKYNQVVRFEFTAKTDKDGNEYKTAEDYAGMSFKLVYTATDADGKYATAQEYVIEVADADVLTNNVDKNLIINFPTINEEIDPNAALTFTTATAKEEPKDSTMVADERVEVRTYYYYGGKDAKGKTEIENILADYIDDKSSKDPNYVEKYGYDFDTFLTEWARKDLDISEQLESVDGKTELTLTGYVEQKSVVVFAVAINDQGQFVIKAQEIAINNTDEDRAPVLYGTPVSNYEEQMLEYSKGVSVSAFNQNCLVKLPAVSFIDYDKDNNVVDSSLQVKVTCYVDTPDQTVGVTVEDFVQKITGECGIGVAELTTTYAGTYYVVYTATDDAGNTASYVSTFEVAKTEKAYIKVDNDEHITKTIGEEVKFNISLAGDGEYTYSADDFDISWGENKPSGLGSTAHSFKFDKAGTYVATISAKYSMNNIPGYETPDVTITVTITEPKMTWEADVDKFLQNRTAEKGETIELEVISAIENGKEINAEPKVVFTDSKGNETDVEVLLNEESFNNYYFVTDANKDGVYKVTYTATTDYNSESKSFTITCGDYYAPTVIIGNNKLDNSKITYNGEDITFKTTFVQDDDAENGNYILTIVATEKESKKQLFSYDIKVDLKDVNATGGDAEYFTPNSWNIELTGDSVSSKTTSGNTSTWSIQGVGSYELSLTVRDSNNNATTKTIEFSVSNKTEPKSIKDEVVGVVLIIVSVVVLGGVILFFALAGKRNKSRRKTIKSNKD